MEQENNNNNSDKVTSLAKNINDAEAIIILTGAGMGVDSGLATFRGKHAKGWTHSVTGKDIDYYDICQGTMFDKKDHPESNEAIKFWNECRNSYINAEPHKGYDILMKWVSKKPYFVFTTNVDHHWARAGVPNNQLLEIHGSVDKMQCSQPRNNECLILQNWDGDKKCPSCQAKLRPNILMFNDRGYIDEHQTELKKGYKQFIKDNQNKKIVLLVIGAGEAVPTISAEVKSLLRQIPNCTEIVINPDNLSNRNGIATGALDGLQQIDNELIKQKEVHLL